MPVEGLRVKFWMCLHAPTGSRRPLLHLHRIAPSRGCPRALGCTASKSVEPSHALSSDSCRVSHLSKGSLSLRIQCLSNGEVGGKKRQKQKKSHIFGSGQRRVE
ncbi:hypothetical protein Bca4012_076392 [Brassica carinata]|uniref:Uncharacterized protein n=1 Tax=Brassica carinata TaxID=52824 RepID=A0A8X7Q9W9_BRACI|nr:hypothetical protein Bca52824_073246 [Brassica carinata]